MKDIHINVFRSRKDNLVRPLPTSWENIVGLFTSDHEVVENKEEVYLFNAAHYKEVEHVSDYSEDWYVNPQTGTAYAKRRQVNIVEVDLLILDYDDNTTIDEIKDRFHDYEYVCYSATQITPLNSFLPLLLSNATTYFPYNPYRYTLFKEVTSQ